MASSVEKEVGAAGAGAGAGEEPLSLELPAPPGWQKKVPLLIPNSFTIQFFFFFEEFACYFVPILCFSSNLCGFRLFLRFVLCLMVSPTKDFFFFSHLVVASRI